MEKIGIITFHSNHNYGTMLQAYALQHYIENLGYDVELIDYVEDTSLSKTGLIKLRLKRIPAYIRHFYKYFTLFKYRNETQNKDILFDDFYKNHLKIGDKHYKKEKELVENPPLYGGYIVGSDQTWNPYISSESEAFFLNFVKDDKKKGSYAPSIAVSSLTDEQKKKFFDNLNKFPFLSCREDTGSKLLGQILGREVQTLIDPTLLLSADEWDIVSTQPDLHQSYILTYFLGDVKTHREFVKNLSLKLSLPVVSIPCSYLEMANRNNNLQWVGPDKFLGLIKNAAYVCTDSFHGTAFSINFKVPFFAFCKTKDSNNLSENSRLYNVLEKFGLSDRLMKDENVPEKLEVSFDFANEVLSAERKKSDDYLRKMLSTITR